ncbi:MAG: hypothetical protein EGR97_05255 [Clostridiales bacterium]|nr:hypothetical protein [Clostridiales bacterium]
MKLLKRFISVAFCAFMICSSMMPVVSANTETYSITLKASEKSASSGFDGVGSDGDIFSYGNEAVYFNVSAEKAGYYNVSAKLCTFNKDSYVTVANTANALTVINENDGCYGGNTNGLITQKVNVAGVFNSTGSVNCTETSLGTGLYLSEGTNNVVITTSFYLRLEDITFTYSDIQTETAKSMAMLPLTFATQLKNNLMNTGNSSHRFGYSRTQTYKDLGGIFDLNLEPGIYKIVARTRALDNDYNYLGTASLKVDGELIASNVPTATTTKIYDAVLSETVEISTAGNHTVWVSCDGAPTDPAPVKDAMYLLCGIIVEKVGEYIEPAPSLPEGDPKVLKVNQNTVAETTGDKYQDRLTLWKNQYFTYNTMSADETKQYSFIVNAATTKDTARYTVIVNGKEYITNGIIQNTGSYGIFAENTLGNVTLTKGNNIITVKNTTDDSGGGAIVNHFKLSSVLADEIPGNAATFSINKNTVDSTTASGDKLADNYVLIDTSTELTYNIYTKNAGKFLISVNSGAMADGKMKVLVDDEEQISNGSVSGSGTLTNFTQNNLGVITLKEGNNAITFTMSDGSAALNAFTLTRYSEYSEEIEDGRYSRVFENPVQISGDNVHSVEIYTERALNYSLSANIDKQSNGTINVKVNDSEQISANQITGSLGENAVLGNISLKRGMNVIEFTAATGTVTLNGINLSAIDSFVNNELIFLTQEGKMHDAQTYGYTSGNAILKDNNYVEFDFYSEKARTVILSYNYAAKRSTSQYSVSINGEPQITNAGLDYTGNMSAWEYKDVTAPVMLNIPQGACTIRYTLTYDNIYMHSMTLYEPEDELIITNFEVKNDYDERLPYTLRDGLKGCAAVTLQRFGTPSQKTIKLFVAQYKNNILEGVESVPINTLQIPEGVKKTFYTPTIELKEGGDLKAFLWNGEILSPIKTSATHELLADIFTQEDIEAIKNTTITYELSSDVKKNDTENYGDYGEDNIKSIFYTGHNNTKVFAYMGIPDPIPVGKVIKFKVSDGETESGNFDFTPKYVDRMWQNSKIKWTVEAEKEGLYELKFRYATAYYNNNNYSNNYVYNLIVNNESIVTDGILSATEKDWNYGRSGLTKHTLSTLIPLKQGTNTIVWETPEYADSDNTIRNNAIGFSKEDGFALYLKECDDYTETKVPAVICVHGGGGEAYKEWVKKWNDIGVAAISMDLYGGGPEEYVTGGEGVNAGNGMQKHPYAGITPFDFSSEDGGKAAGMYQSVVNVMYAYNLLAAMPEIDATKIGITGISWGGITTTTTIGVDDRLKFAIPVYGCGYLDKSRTYFSTDYFTKSDQTIAWDPANFAVKAKIPVMYINNDSDAHFSVNSTSNTAAVTENGFMSIHHGLAHSHVHGYEIDQIYKFAADMFNTGTDRFMRIKNTVIDSNEMIVEYEAPEGTTAESATMYYITDAILPWSGAHSGVQAKAIDWKTVEGTMDGNSVKVTLPDDAAYAYVAVCDNQGNIISTKLVKTEF